MLLTDISGFSAIVCRILFLLTIVFNGYVSAFGALTLLCGMLLVVIFFIMLVVERINKKT